MLRMIIASVSIVAAVVGAVSAVAIYPSQARAEVRATAYGHAIPGVQYGEFRNTLGYEMVPGPDNDLMALDQAFEIPGCYAHVSYIVRADLNDSSYGLSKVAVRDLQLTRLRFITGNGVARFYSRVFCHEMDGQEFRGFPLFAPYSFNGAGDVDLVSYLEHKYIDRKIELIGLLPVLVDRTLFLVVDFEVDESFRGYEFVKLDFSQNAVQLTDISSSLSNLLGSLDMEDLLIDQFGLLNGELAFSYRKGRSVAASSRLGLLTTDLKTSSTINMNAERLWEGKMLDDRFFVSVGSSSDLGGGSFTRTAHTIVDWKTKQVVPDIAETTVPNGCSLMKTIQPDRTETKSSYAFPTLIGSCKGIVTVSVDHLSCVVAGSVEPEYVARVKATRLELDAAGNPVVSVIFDQELDRTTVPDQAGDVLHGSFGHYLFGYQNGADTDFVLMLRKTVSHYPQKKTDFKEVRLVYDAAKAELRVR